mmetsp:Transcript_24050/g.75721  ORF Transcript_24050/g.75721 Transcript_24050/m.75721 type:complete len:242 (-) Transcript_24050:179-904(-)
MTTLTGKMIKVATGEYDLETIRAIDIDGADIERINDDISQCQTLERLTLSNNCLRNVRVLATLPSLRRLDLSHNRIFDIGGLEALVNLEYLDLRGNMVSDVGVFANMAGMAALRQLWMGSGGANSPHPGGPDKNPCCEHPSYFAIVRQHLPNVEMLDGEDLRLRQFCGDALLDDLQPDPEAAAPLPHERWFEASQADEFVSRTGEPVEIIQEGEEELDAIQDAVKDTNFALVRAERLLAQR